MDGMLTRTIGFTSTSTIKAIFGATNGTSTTLPSLPSPSLATPNFIKKVNARITLLMTEFEVDLSQSQKVLLPIWKDRSRWFLL